MTPSDNYLDYATARCPKCKVDDTTVRECRDAEQPCHYCGYDGWILPRCCIPDCERVLAWTSTYPVCRDCGVKIALLHWQEASLRSEVAAEHRKLRRDGEKARQVRLARNAQVYYVRLDDDRIKIGFSSHLQERIKSFRVPLTNLLACEPGGRDVEKARHQQFRGDMVRSEEFSPSPRLLAWIEQVRGAHGLPDWASRPDTKTVTVRRAG